jgi:gentisate 1,2-dioxygenase
LSSGPAPDDGRRRSLIAHPCAVEPGLGLAPGIQVALNVLRPGERTRPIRHNSTQLDFCIRGRGRAVVGTRTIDFERYDVWNTPSMATYTIANDGDEPQVRLTYSNAALLEKLNIHVVEDDPPPSGTIPPSSRASRRRAHSAPFASATTART